jgi:hypothetical protein
MAAMPDLPPSQHQQERIVCSIIAAEKYAVPANIMLAIAEKENGEKYQRHPRRWRHAI